jgi:hypothetical protein
LSLLGTLGSDRASSLRSGFGLGSLGLHGLFGFGNVPMDVKGEINNIFVLHGFEFGVQTVMAVYNTLQSRIGYFQHLQESNRCSMLSMM